MKITLLMILSLKKRFKSLRRISFSWILIRNTGLSSMIMFWRIHLELRRLTGRTFAFLIIKGICKFLTCSKVSKNVSITLILEMIKKSVQLSSLKRKTCFLWRFTRRLTNFTWLTLTRLTLRNLMEKCITLRANSNSKSYLATVKIR